MRPRREIVNLSMLFLGPPYPLRSHTLHISHLNRRPDTKRKKLLQLHPCFHLLSLPRRDLRAPAQFYIELFTFLFNLFSNKNCNSISRVLISVVQHQHQEPPLLIKRSVLQTTGEAKCLQPGTLELVLSLRPAPPGGPWINKQRLREAN